MWLSTVLRRLLRQDDGASLAEYALLVLFIMFAVVGALQLLGSSIQQPFANIASAL